MHLIIKRSILLVLLTMLVIGTSSALQEVQSGSLKVSNVTSISNVTDIYFSELAKSENVTGFESERILLSTWSPDGSKVLVLTRHAPYGEPELDGFYLVNADGTEPKEIIATRNNTMEKSLELIANEHFEIARWNSAGDRIAFYGNVVRVNDTFVVLNGESFIGSSGVGIVGIADVDGNLVKFVATGLSGVESIRLNSTDRGYVHGLEWGPDGTDVAVIFDGDLCITDQDVSFLNQITNSSIEENVDECMWNHKGDRIAFTGDDLWIIDKHGNGLQRIASDADRLIGWSPDDSRIYYANYGGESCSQFVVRLNDSKVTKITTGNLDDNLIIGPDGKILLINTTFEGSSPKYSRLYVADADGTSKKLLAENTSEDSYLISRASWSPEGDKIATPFNIINANGSGKYDIELGRTFAWHPSGNYLAFTTGESVGGRYITKVCVVNSDATGFVQVSPDDGYSYSFDGWSSDGSRMLTTKRDSGHTEELFVVRFSGFDEIMSLDFKDYTTLRKDVHISVTSMSEPVQHALITLDGREIGVTDENGSLIHIIEEPGTHMLNASKEGYLDSGKELTVYGDAMSSVKDDEVSDSIGSPDDQKSATLDSLWDWLHGIMGN